MTRNTAAGALPLLDARNLTPGCVATRRGATLTRTCRGLAAHAQRRAFEVLLSRWRKARCNAVRHGRIVTQWAGRGLASSAGSREGELADNPGELVPDRFR
jgi:hypothetical protein